MLFILFFFGFVRSRQGGTRKEKAGAVAVLQAVLIYTARNCNWMHIGGRPRFQIWPLDHHLRRNKARVMPYSSHITHGHLGNKNTYSSSSFFPHSRHGIKKKNKKYKTQTGERSYWRSVCVIFWGGEIWWMVYYIITNTTPQNSINVLLT